MKITNLYLMFFVTMLFQSCSDLEVRTKTPIQKPSHDSLNHIFGYSDTVITRWNNGGIVKHESYNGLRNEGIGNDVKRRPTTDGIMADSLDSTGGGSNAHFSEVYVPCSTRNCDDCITKSDMIEYMKECFNDSAVHYYWTSCDLGGCWDTPCNKGDKNAAGGDCPEHWTNRVATFEGFSQWIRNKQKRNNY